MTWQVAGFFLVVANCVIAIVLALMLLKNGGRR